MGWSQQQMPRALERGYCSVTRKLRYLYASSITVILNLNIISLNFTEIETFFLIQLSFYFHRRPNLTTFMQFNSRQDSLKRLSLKLNTLGFVSRLI